jgi:U4/U6 small nuclear ribonucleoprotein PRP31
MATLADELLADLMSGSEDEEESHEFLEEDGENATPTVSSATDVNGEMDIDATREDEDEEMENDTEDTIRAAAAAGKSAVTEAEDELEAKARVEKMQLGGISDVRSVAGLMKTLKPVLEVSPISRCSLNLRKASEFTVDCNAALTRVVLQKIDHFQSLPHDKRTKNTGSIEDNPEYRLLVQANALSAAIDNETILVHKFIRDHYSIRFPELESLIQNPLLYAKTVAIIGNGPMDNMEMASSTTDELVGQSLKQILDGPSLMVVRLEATKTTGRVMTESELLNVRRACEMTLQLDKAKIILTDYVQSRMNLFAPNLTVLVGSETAAQLVNTAGGLTALAKIPACNVAAMGSRKQTFGMATNVRVRRQGHLYHSPIIEAIPNDMKNQGMRIVSAKLILAARSDRVHATPDGSTGERLKLECEERLEKLTQPAPNKGPRALPAPDVKPSRKRGGRRARKAKEMYAVTDLRKAQNRMAFGKEEQEVGYGTGEGTQGMGMIGQTNDGRVRATQIDQRTKAKLSKKNPGWGGATPGSGLASSLRGFGQGGGQSVLQGHGLRSSGVGAGGGTGTNSVISFTPIQGLELALPKAKEDMERKRKAEEDRWFKSGTFTQIGGGSAPKAPEGKVDSAGFKVPAIPTIKRLKKA